MEVKQDPTVYVLSEKQHLEALIRGAVSMGIVPGVKGKALEVGGGDGEFVLASTSCDFVANGCILTFGIGSQPATGSEELDSSESVIAPELAVPKALEPERIKEKLEPHMARTPSVATIRTWSHEERRVVLRWIKKGAVLANRPAHVVEPKARTRGARSPGEGSSTSQPTPEPSNGQASGFVEEATADDPT